MAATNAQSKKWQAEQGPNTPYRKAQQEWDARMGSSLKQARIWKGVAFFCLGLAGVGIAGMIYLGTLPKSIVEYVTVDGTGTATYLGATGRDWNTFTPTEAQVSANIRRFIHDTRSLSSDQMIIRSNWVDAYTLLAGEAAQIANQYAQTHDPFQRSQDLRINVIIESALPVTSDTWQVDWIEELWSTQGVLTATEAWRGSFTVTRLQPDTEEAMRDNPIGVYITRFSWQQVAR